VKKKKKPFKFTFKVFIRIVVFLIIFVLILFYVSSSISQKEKNNYYQDKYEDSILGDQTVANLYEQIPPHIKEPIENISQNSVIIYVEEKIQEIKDQGSNFLGNQIKEIKKTILKAFFQNINKSIENTYDNMVNEIDNE
jgi:predicted PurR-regulated permease PerM